MKKWIVWSLCLLGSWAFMFPQKTDPVIKITTPQGDIHIRLFDNTPEHRDNFLKLVREGYFDSTLFHRVIPNFMIQGGDPNSKNAQPGQALGTGGPGYTIDEEISNKNIHLRGALAAARQGDHVNPKKKSSGSQFYIVQGNAVNDQQLDALEKRKGFEYTEEQRLQYKMLGGTPFLDGDYTVFGMVVDGFEVLEKISHLHELQQKKSSSEELDAAERMVYKRMRESTDFKTIRAISNQPRDRNDRPKVDQMMQMEVLAPSAEAEEEEE